MRTGHVFIDETFAGTITETHDGHYQFRYDAVYLEQSHATAVSLTLPLTEVPYKSPTLFPFFDGLIPEGWLLDLSASHWKLKANDRMGVLLSACEDCIGNVSVRKVIEHG